MKRKYVDTNQYESRNMAEDGNIDYRFWHDKTPEERLHAASIMIAVAFREPDFLKNKVDRTVFSARKHKL